MQVIEARLYGGDHDGWRVEVPNTACLLAVSQAGDAEVIAHAEAADAVVRGRDLYRADPARLMAYKHTSLHELFRQAA